MTFTESTIEQTAIDWLKDLGYDYAFGPEIAFDGGRPEWGGYQEVVLFERLRNALLRINPHNGESFIVRHVYFTGADQPYDKLERALRAEIDESAWSLLYTTESIPFEKPSTGKIAVKVINHYGDEILKVFEVGSRPR